jgi:hypothetical protein
LAGLIFLCGFFWTALDNFRSHFGWQAPYLVVVTAQAIEKNLPAAAKLHPAQPLQLTGDDVAKASRWPLADNTRRWLTGARISVTPDKAHPGGFYCAETPRVTTECYFSATIHLADGTDIFESLGPVVERKRPWGNYSVSVRWPGAKGQESLWDR